MILQHRFALGLVILAVVATAGFFVFARPEYRDPAPGNALVFNEAEAPAHGWTWRDGTPGFHFGEHRGEWNISHLLPRELASPPGLRNVGVLQVSRTSPTGRPHALLAGTNAAGRTCLAVQLHRGPVSALCPPELDRKVGLVVADASSWTEHGHSMFLMGIARADVTRVTIETPGATYVDHTGSKPVVRPFGAQTVYTRGPGSWWGTFAYTTSQPRQWLAHVVFYGARGELASTSVRFRRPGEKFVLAAP